MSVNELLCGCAFPIDDPEASVRLGGLSVETIDWSTVPALLAQHGLTILAASHLETVRRHIPPTVWNTIQCAALRARALALVMSAELLRLLRALTAAGVSTLSFKGPLLGLDAYGDLAARPFDDLDLLVYPHDMNTAITTLGRLDYASSYCFSPAQDRWFRHVDGDYPLIHKSSGILVELHLRVTSRRFGPGINTDNLWRRRHTVQVAGESVAVLSADDQLYLCLLHGAKHRWERLEWLASVNALLKHRGGDVSALLDGPHVEARAVLLGCQLAHELLGAPLHVETAKAIAADSTVMRLAREARLHMFDRQPLTDQQDTAGKLWFNYRIAHGVLARVRFGSRWMFWPSPEDWEAITIPDPLFSLYRIVRPARLMWRYVRPIVGISGRANG